MTSSSMYFEDGQCWLTKETDQSVYCQTRTQTSNLKEFQYSRPKLEDWWIPTRPNWMNSRSSEDWRCCPVLSQKWIICAPVNDFSRHSRQSDATSFCGVLLKWCFSHASAEIKRHKTPPLLRSVKWRNPCWCY